MNELAQALSEKFGLPIESVWADFETIVQRFIKYEIIQSFVTAAIMLVFAAIGGYVLKLVINDYRDCWKLKSDTKFFEYDFDSVWPSIYIAFAIVYIVFAFIMGVVGIVEIFEGTKWILIPEIQIVEWLGR